MIARPEYAQDGLIALLTPQANTTVEPEFSVLLPDRVAWINGRMTSTKTTIHERLVDYMEGLAGSARQFGNAPVDALAVGCTGTAYFVGATREDDMLAAVANDLGVPVFSAATAALDALARLGATNVVLVSPYEGMVDEACTPYWQSRGLNVVDKINASGPSGFHPIYSLQSQAGDAAVRQVAETNADCVLILGTGMPTLATLLRLAPRMPMPVLSCMQCLGWRAAAAVDDNCNNAQGVQESARGSAWARRLVRFGGG